MAPFTRGLWKEPNATRPATKKGDLIGRLSKLGSSQNNQPSAICAVVISSNSRVMFA